MILSVDIKACCPLRVVFGLKPPLSPPLGGILCVCVCVAHSLVGRRCKKAAKSGTRGVVAGGSGQHEGCAAGKLGGKEGASRLGERGMVLTLCLSFLTHTHIFVFSFLAR